MTARLRRFRSFKCTMFRRDPDSYAPEPLSSYKKVRNKLIAHTEVTQSTEGLKRFPIESLRLKFGDERRLLRETIKVVHELRCLTGGGDDSWESIRHLYEPEVCAFWDVEALDDLCP